MLESCDDAVQLRAAAWADVERRIRCVPEYADENRVQLAEEVVALTSLHPLCRLARSYRLVAVTQLIAVYDAAGLPLFSGVWLTSDIEPARLISPPVIEEHTGRLVIIDGLHRLFEAARTGRRSVSVVVLRGGLQRLPADTLRWEEVSLTDHKTSRDAKFRNLDDSVFRPIHKYIDLRS